MKKHIFSFVFLSVIFSSCENQNDINPNSTKFYLHENGITCKCPGTRPGDKGLIYGVEYESVDNRLLRQRIDEGKEMALLCTSLVTDMKEIFSGDIVNYRMSEFNQPIGNWDVSNVTDMSYMFFLSYFNQQIGDWDVGSVENMSFMFSYSPFNQDIGSWNVGNVKEMVTMFLESQFNQPIGGWDVRNVLDMSLMFGRSQFNQPINEWDVSNVTNMSYMFARAAVRIPANYYNDNNSRPKFNQPIGDWDVANVVDMSAMFDGASFNQNISNWCVTNITSEPLNFSRFSPLTPGNKPKWGTCPN